MNVNKNTLKELMEAVDNFDLPKSFECESRTRSKTDFKYVTCDSKYVSSEQE